MPGEWTDLSDAELSSRLIYRGFLPSVADALVVNRDSEAVAERLDRLFNEERV